jgi:hypothetical protein
MPNWKRASWTIPVALVCVSLVLIGLHFASRPPWKPGAGLIRPAMDLRRVIVPPDVVSVAEQSSHRLELVTDEWILCLNSIESDYVGGILDSYRRMVQSLPASREDVLDVPGSHVLHRFLFGVTGLSCANKVCYVVSFGDGLGWAHGWGTLRDVGAMFDVTPFDEVLLALRLADKPQLDLEVPPAWLAYQSKRTAGLAIAKFVLSPEAPVTLGRDKAMDRDWARFSDDEFRQGGRQVAPDVIEFYIKEQTIFFVRLDVWLNTRPTGRREPIFEGTLRLDNGMISLQAFDERFHAPVPPGDYDVSISRVNAGKHSDTMLTDAEYFQRDDLERYEVILNSRHAD